MEQEPDQIDMMNEHELRTELRLIVTRLLDAEELIRVLTDFAEHDRDCLAGQCRQGEPTEDGRYRRLYGYKGNEKWYYGDDLPPCSCGLTEALEKWERLSK